MLYKIICLLFCSRTLCLIDLNVMFLDSQIPLCVVGKAGYGKTALLCNWIKLYCYEDTVIYHFVGVGSESTSKSFV